MVFCGIEIFCACFGGALSFIAEHSSCAQADKAAAAKGKAGNNDAGGDDITEPLPAHC